MPEFDSSLLGIAFQARSRPEGCWVTFQELERRHRWWGVICDLLTVAVTLAAIALVALAMGLGA